MNMGIFNVNKETLNQLPAWLARANIAWLFIASLFVVSILGDWVGCFADRGGLDSIRYSGWIFEILGLLSVAIGLNKKLDLLDQKGIWQRIKEWARQWPILSQDAVVGTMGAQLGAFGADLRGRGNVSIDESQSFAAQVKFLLEELERLRDEFSAAMDQQRKDTSELRKEVRRIEETLKGEIKRMASKSAKAQVGDVGWEIAGLFWVLIGVTLATVPEAIAYVFSSVIGFFIVFTCPA